MANYKGGASTICPYYSKEANKSITCQGAIEKCTHMTRFESKEDKEEWQDKVCSTYDYIKCPIASMIEKGKEPIVILPKRITESEKMIYDFIVMYATKNLYPPSVREISKGTFYANGSVFEKLRNLEKFGLIEISESKNRNIKLKGYKMIKID